MTEFVGMLAQIAQAAPPTTPPTTSSPAGAFLPIAMMVALVAFMLLSARSQKKREKRERDEMYARLTKNDRVVTVGGVLGTIVAVKGDEVVLKVDESTNTKMTFLRSSVQRIISDGDSSKSGK